MAHAIFWGETEMKHEKAVKTNAMRLLDQAQIPYRTAEYAYDENDLSGMHADPGGARGPKRGAAGILHPGLLRAGSQKGGAGGG